MGKIFSIIIEAGGAGKTNTTLHTAWELAMRGKKVLMIDMDGQSGNLTFFTGISVNDDTYTMYDILQRNKNIESAILPVRENLDLIPAKIDILDISQRSTIPRMQEVIRSVKDRYDFIFIDNNPDPTWRHALTLSVTDEVIALMTGDYKSLEACYSILKSIEELKPTNPKLHLAGFLFNRFDQRLSIARSVYSAAQKMSDTVHTKIFNTIIRQDVLFTETSAMHQGITELAPKSRGAEDIRSFADELEALNEQEK